MVLLQISDMATSGPNGLVVTAIAVIMVMILLLVMVAVYFLKSIHNDFKSLKQSVIELMTRQAQSETNEKNMKGRLDSHGERLREVEKKVK
jgi:flagellar biogenesis protein FliO